MIFSKSIGFQKNLFFGNKNNIAHHKYINLINYTNEAKKLLTMTRSELFLTEVIQKLKEVINFIENLRDAHLTAFEEEKTLLTEK
ncbi:hypothetical protein COT98_03820 [Candidatus Falkowbacteria bacterium CG10_big_fil_rev_8_21_14_0_10_39_9]|uniref:Uncharacterized protein n=1 Tax=Candidatus Falkowbacteria bacterium CG10_big_fil_rev_8_21_14_0_10_39_9 TaxID=1974566 RepID=A0A2M6WNN9_9BACT|nr:MAG: hypothetical protein COT98_03820 [Candidatus Falkowbacteria bacterium CG10_big_fil_rev_8_21_14_0_10_39_9]